MADVVPPEKRSNMMSGIQGKNTRPELRIRSMLHARGFRYKLHDKSLPGTPDLVFPRYKAVIQINGCFWHGHDCHLFKIPSTRTDFWLAKISSNIERDKINADLLHKMGYRLMIVWECALKGKMRKPLEGVLDQITDWLKSDEGFREID